MPVRVEWFDGEQTVIHWKMSGDWTWEEYTSARRRLAVMQNNLGYLVDHIYDVRKSNGLPPNALSQFLSASKSMHPNTSGMVVVVGGSMLARQLGGVLMRIRPNTRLDITFIPTIEQAPEHIEARRKIHRARLSSS